MQLDFRQGIVQARSIINVPDFLSWNSTLQTVDIGITAPWLIVTAAFKTQNYLIEERGSQSQSWGPFSWNLMWGVQPTLITWQLYWDINTATGVVTKGYTPHVPITSLTAPISPVIDQHWFSTIDNIMYVWDSQFWQVKCRVFAASFGVALSQLIHRPFKSQVGITGSFDAGHILYSDDQKGIRTLDGSFLNSATNIHVSTSGNFSSPIKIESASTQLIASEPIPAYHCITNSGLSTAGLANPSDINKLPIGISEHGSPIGSAVNFISEGVLFNDGWSWDILLGKDVYCNSTGQLYQGAPSIINGFLKVGTIITSTSMLVRVDLVGSSGNSSDGILTHNVPVIGTSVGAIDQGYTFLQGTSFTSFVDLVSKRTLPPAYSNPGVTIASVPIPSDIEVGTLLSPVISINFILADAGPVTSQTLSKNIVQISTSYPYTDTLITVGTTSINYQGTVSYAAGPIKNNNLGIPDPASQILAGTVTSNTITFIGSRVAFYGFPGAVPSTSASVRALGTSSFNSGNNSGVDATGTASGFPTPNFIMLIPAGSAKVVFAYPATSRAVASVKYQELSDSEVKTNFVETSVSVQGANAFNAIPYRVFTYTPVEPFSQAVHYKVYI